MTRHPRGMNGHPHETIPNRHARQPDELAEEYHALLADGAAAETRFAWRAVATTLILAAIVAAIAFGG